MRIDDRILIIEGYLKFGMEKAHICSIKGHTLCTLEKKNLAEARTGSGKTGVFLISCLQHALNAKRTTQQQDVRVLVLMPSK